jgi:ATP-dependent DNA helicase RecG
VLNALVHRDYSIHTEGIPIAIQMYKDRIEIKNPGGLYGNISVEQLGKSMPDTRNEILANALEILGVTENRYSGIPTINKELKNNGLDNAIFKSENGAFSITIYNMSCSKEKGNKKIKGNNIEKKLIEYLRTPKTRDEIISFTGLSKYYAINVILKSMIDNGKVALTLPDVPKSSKQKYYAVLN